MASIFEFDSEHLKNILVVGIFSYAALLVALRASGKRTLTKMNAFDLIVNISLGSILATTLLSDSVNFFSGLAAFTLLIALQFAVTWSSVRAPWVRRLITGEPLLLLKRGAFIPAALKRSRVTEDEIRAAVRSAGLCDLASVEAVVFETDGSFSVVKREGESSLSSLQDVIDHSPSDKGAP